MSRPVPPPRPTWRGVWEKEKLLERAAGVAESSGRIQVSGKPKMLSVDCIDKAEMRSALLTADWQFHKPTEKEGGAVEEEEMGRKLAGLRCRLRVMLDRGWETTGMVWKHDKGEKKEMVSVWREEKIILKCAAGFVAWLKSHRKKSSVFTQGGWTRWLDASADASVSAYKINIGGGCACKFWLLGGLPPPIPPTNYAPGHKHITAIYS